MDDDIQDCSDVLVLGAGVVGVTTAYALARRGLSVTLCDRADQPAQGASFANGAQLSYAYSDPLASPNLLRKLPSLMFGADPLFKVQPSLDVEMVNWGLKFLQACDAAAFRRGVVATLTLALESQRAMHHLLAAHRLRFGHAVSGKMHLYYDRNAMAVAERIVALKQSHGARQQVLSVAEAVALEPALAGASGLVGAVHSPEDEVGDPLRFCIALQDLMIQRFSVRVRFGFEAAGVDIRPDHVRVRTGDGRTLAARRLVVAVGPEAGAFLRRLGLRLPILPMKGYSFTAPPGPGAPLISLTDTSRKIVFCNLAGEIRIAGVAELGVSDPHVDKSRLIDLVEAARASLPEAADYQRRNQGWAGLRPMTPTSLPIIRRVAPRIIVNGGHGMLGWTLAMGSAERAAGLVLQDAA